MIRLAERGLVPDFAIRIGIRRLLAKRLNDRRNSNAGSEDPDLRQFVDELKRGPIAVATETANDQHYEVPAEFFEKVLGPRLKYSCCFYENDQADLDAAEEAMLALTCRRAEIEDGMDVLDLGCGWGSFSLWIAQHFPRCRVTAVSNSNAQRRFIENRCRANDLHNVSVITADMRCFQADKRFDRVVSIEMFEHMRNHELLLNRIANWLRPDGKLFVHIFCHRAFAYMFETDGADNWMGRHFFTGGIMPSWNLLRHCNRNMTVCRDWQINGRHYGRTCEDWLRNLDAKRQSLFELFARSQSKSDAKITLQRWRMFFMACAESFNYGGGNEWHVGHYLLTPTVNTAAKGAFRSPRHVG